MQKNNSKGMQKNAQKQSGQPEPLSGSKKIKNQNHSKANKNPHHGM